MITRHLLRSLAVAGVAAMLAAVTHSASAQATLPLYEPFNYTAGSLLPNGGWTQTGNPPNTSAPVQVVAGSLAYAGLPTPVGGKVVVLNGSGFEDPGLDFTGVTGAGNSVFVSAIVNVKSEGSVAAGDYILHVSSAGTASTDYRSRVFVKPGASAGTFSVGIRNGSADVVQYGGDYPINTPVFVVVSYDIVDGTTNDVSRLWVNPALGQATPPAATATATATGSDIATVGRIGLRQGSASTAQDIDVDELRVATTWASVTPSAASVADWQLF